MVHKKNGGAGCKDTPIYLVSESDSDIDLNDDCHLFAGDGAPERKLRKVSDERYEKVFRGRPIDCSKPGRTPTTVIIKYKKLEAGGKYCIKDAPAYSCPADTQNKTSSTTTFAKSEKIKLFKTYKIRLGLPYINSFPSSGFSLCDVYVVIV